MVMHPIKPELNGKDLSGIKDFHGKYLFSEMMDLAKRESKGFAVVAAEIKDLASQTSVTAEKVTRDISQVGLDRNTASGNSIVIRGSEI